MIKKSCLCLVLLVVSGMIWLPAAFAHTDSTIDKYQLFVDSTRSLTLEDVLRLERDGALKQVEGGNKTYGYTDDAYWIKIESAMLPFGKPHYLEIGNPSLNRIDVYVLYADGEWTHHKTGDIYPFQQRAIQERSFFFPLDLDERMLDAVWVRMESGGIMHFPLSLWDAAAMVEHHARSHLLWGLYFGCMGVMWAYHLFLFFLTRHRNYLYYILFIFILTMVQVADSGYGFQYFWPDYPLWNEVSVLVIGSLGISIFLFFSRNLLDTRQFVPRIDRALAVLTFIFLVLSAVVAPMPYDVGAVILMVLFLMMFLLLIPSVYMGWRNHHEPVMFYVLAFSSLLTAGVISVMKPHLLPLNWFTSNVNKFGSVFFVIFLSFSVGSYLRTVRQNSEHERRQRLLLQELHEYSRTLSSTLDLNEMMPFILRKMMDVTGAAHGLVLLRTEEGFDFTAADGRLDRGKIRAWLHQADVRDKLEECFRLESTGMVAPSSLKLQELTEKTGSSRSEPYVLAIPISQHHEMSALVIVFGPEMEVLQEDLREQLTDYANQARMAVTNAKMYMTANHYATRDSLTGLFNRKYVFEEGSRTLNAAQAEETPWSVIMLDVDHFKQINDSLGHGAGDRVLRYLAEELVHFFPKQDIVGRYGGEEFTIILPGTTVNEAVELAERLRNKLDHETVQIEDRSVKLTVSLGVAGRTGGAVPTDFNRLLEAADKALYRAKQDGRNRVAAYPGIE